MSIYAKSICNSVFWLVSFIVSNRNIKIIRTESAAVIRKIQIPKMVVFDRGEIRYIFLVKSAYW